MSSDSDPSRLLGTPPCSPSDERDEEEGEGEVLDLPDTLFTENLNQLHAEGVDDLSVASMQLKLARLHFESARKLIKTSDFPPHLQSFLDAIFSQLGVVNQDQENQENQIADLRPAPDSSDLASFSFLARSTDSVNHFLLLDNSSFGLFPLSFGWIYVVISPILGVFHQEGGEKMVYCKVGKSEVPLGPDLLGGRIETVLKAFFPDSGVRRLCKVRCFKIPCRLGLHKIEGSFRDALAAFEGATIARKTMFVEKQQEIIVNGLPSRLKISFVKVTKEETKKLSGSTEWVWIRDSTIEELYRRFHMGKMRDLISNWEISSAPVEEIQVPSIDYFIREFRHPLRVRRKFAVNEEDLSSKTLTVSFLGCLQCRVEVDPALMLCSGCQDLFDQKRLPGLLEELEWQCHHRDRESCGNWTECEASVILDSTTAWQNFAFDDSVHCISWESRETKVSVHLRSREDVEPWEELLAWERAKLLLEEEEYALSGFESYFN